jgi:hypothetical protein
LLHRFDLNGCTVFEVFSQNIKTGDMARFLTTDDTFWKTFLSNPQTGFVRKARAIPYYDTIANATKIIQVIEWDSFEYRSTIETDIDSMLGYDTNRTYIPDRNGLRMLPSFINSSEASSHPLYSDSPTVNNNEWPAVELLHQVVKSGDLPRFEAVYDEYWTSYLQTQEGYVSKANLIPFFDTYANATDCYQIINWASESQWKSINTEVSVYHYHHVYSHQILHGYYVYNHRN